MSHPRTDSPDVHYATSGLRALSEIAWMARRLASSGDRERAQEFNEANWLLHKMAARAHVRMGHPDGTANQEWDTTNPGRFTETPSYFTDGAPVDFAPSVDRVVELEALTPEEAVQWMVDVIHPLAHAYSDGSSTYAPSMFNDATRILRASGFSMSATEALGKSVWVKDGMGDGFTRLSPSEVRERDAARASG